MNKPNILKKSKYHLDFINDNIINDICIASLFTY